MSKKSPLVQWYDGEPWFDNPKANPILTLAANPKKRKVTKMSRSLARRPRRANGRFIKVNKPRRAARSHRPRRNVYLNRRRPSKRSPHRIRRRSYRRNPPAQVAGPRVFGFQLPAIDAVIWTGVGFVAPAALTSIVMGFIPDSWKTSSVATWGARIAAVLVPSMLIRKMVSPRAGNQFLVGAGTSFVLDLARTYAPGVIPGLSGYLPIPDERFTAPARTPAPALQFQQRPRLQSNLPERLTPAQGF